MDTRKTRHAVRPSPPVTNACATAVRKAGAYVDGNKAGDPKRGQAEAQRGLTPAARRASRNPTESPMSNELTNIPAVAARDVQPIAACGATVMLLLPSPKRLMIG